MELLSYAIRRLGGAPLAFAILAALGACVSFPDVLDGGGGTGGAGVGTGTSASAGGGTSTGGSSVTASSSGGGASCQQAPSEGGGAPECLVERGSNSGNQAVLSNDGSTLEITAVDEHAWWQAEQGDFLFTEVSGSFAAVVEVTVDGSTETGGVFEVGGLLVRDTSGAWVKFETGRITPSAGINVNTTLDGILLGHTDATFASEHLGIGGEPFYGVFGAAPAPELVGPRTLGLCRHETEGFSFYYRVGEDWYVHATAPIVGSRPGATPDPLETYSTTVEVGLIAGDYGDQDPDTVATFRRFRIGPLDSDLSGCTEDLDALVGEGLSHCGFCVE